MKIKLEVHMEMEALGESKWPERHMLVSASQAVCDALVSAEAQGYNHRLSEETSLRIRYVSMPEKIAEATVKPENAGEPVTAPGENEEGDSILVLSSHGELLMHPFTGCLVGARMFEDADEDFPRIIAFDLREYRGVYGEKLPPAIDILDIGFWYALPNGSQDYEPPVRDWREESEKSMPTRYVNLVFYPVVTKEGRDYDLNTPVEFRVPRSWFLERFPESRDWILNQPARRNIRHHSMAPAGIADWPGPYRIELAQHETPWTDELD